MTGLAPDLSHSAYESPDIVALYARPDGLQRPEQALLARLAPSLGTIAWQEISCQLPGPIAMVSMNNSAPPRSPWKRHVICLPMSQSKNSSKQLSRASPMFDA